MTIRGHFDGRVVVLDEPVSFHPNQRVIVSAEAPTDARNFGTVGYALANLGSKLSDADAQEMMDIVEKGCEHVDSDPDFQF